MRIARIGSSDSAYPWKLVHSGLNLELWVWGHLPLLQRESVSICGSREATESGLQLSEEFGKSAAESEYVVVSGYARGVDTRAHVGSMKAGGATIAVLAEGMDHFRMRRDLKPLVEEENFLAISPYPPQSRWTTWRAMDRNRLIVGLSKGLFVIEAGETGGTISAGNECLRQGKPLWVLEYSAETSSHLGTSCLSKRVVSRFGA